MAAKPPPVREDVDVSVPLFVELKRGLLTGDPAVEYVLSLVRTRPLLVLRALSSGRRELRRLGQSSVDRDVRFLPYNDAVLQHLRTARDAGRRIVLVAEAGDSYAAPVAQHLGLIDEIVETGPAGPEAALTERFGANGFERLGGDAGRDWSPKASARDVLRALRPHQWLKNALIFLPVLGGQQLTNPVVMGKALLAFAAFSLAASFVYVVNDLLDLQEDRRHPSKRLRPFASGRLPVRWALPMSAGLLVPAVLIAVLALPGRFGLALAVYLVLTLAYSVKLKGAVLIDVFTLAALYTLRVIAGSAATGIEPSVWLLGFSMFFFLSLALVKRYAELHTMRGQPSGQSRLPGRSYDRRDLPVLVALGVATGCMSVLVLALYVISDEFAQRYTHPALLWQLCPLTLYWIGRAWMVVSRDEMQDDPLVWAVKDQLSRWVAIAALLLLLFAR